VILSVCVLALVLFFSMEGQNKAPRLVENNIHYYTCGMHPSVKVFPKDYDNGHSDCPICHMALVPIQHEVNEHDHSQAENETSTAIEGGDIDHSAHETPNNIESIAHKITIKENHIQVAGVQTVQVKKHNLFKEIRTVGNVAFDPELTIAKEEYVSSLNAYDTIYHSNIPEIKKRAYSLIDSAKGKLKLLGLSDNQINHLKKTRKVSRNLIFPKSKMWIYGIVYEYELHWLTSGQDIEVTSHATPGKIFKGVITSIHPVLDSKTRSIKFQAEVANQGLALQPNMYVDVYIKSYLSSSLDEKLLAIPKEVVLNTGTTKIAWVDEGNNVYEKRIIDIGPESTAKIDGNNRQFYPVLNGLEEGEIVVARGNFLIDSQSQISGAAASVYSGALDGNNDLSESEISENRIPGHHH